MSTPSPGENTPLPPASVPEEKSVTEPTSSLATTGGGCTIVPPLPLPGPRILPEWFGRYQILKPLGVGGMASVYLARDSELDRLVALKVPHVDPRHAPQLLERFAREARAAAMLHHPNICSIFDVGNIDGVPYLTMAYIEGQTLAQKMTPPRHWPERQAASLVQTIARVLEEAHRHGVIHRDLKPSNIMIDQRDEPIVMDFGLARRQDRGDQQLTQFGMVMGTPAYMPPEQVTGDVEAMGPACDVYSLGVILYELLTGRTPFLGAAASILTQILNREPATPQLYRPDLDPRLDAICRQALAKTVAARFARMQELVDALQAVLDGPPAVPSVTAPVAEDRWDKPGGSPVRTLTLPPRPVGPELAQVALDLFHTWGWAMGLRKFKSRVQGTREPQKRASLQLLLDWLAGEDGASLGLADAHRPEPWHRRLLGWALAGRASGALRDRDYRQCHRWLNQVRLEGDSSDSILQATLSHTRATSWSHEGKTSEALRELHEALAGFGKDHFATGRVLDTLGMVYAGRGNFRMAREFYEQAIRFKEQRQDDPGLALSHGQLGRLYLDWGQADQAEEHFQADLRLAERLLDQRGQAQMYNHLGQVALARAEREAAANRKATMRRHCAESAGWLDSSIRLSQECQSAVTEGFGRKDRALVYLLEGNLVAAEEQAGLAENLFRGAGFHEGTALVNRLWGVLRRTQGRCDEAVRKLRSSLAHFESFDEHAECTRTLWELARTQRDAKSQTPLVSRAFLEALARAEQCRRGHLVQAIEQELREVDPDAYYRHLCRRVRGQGDWEETADLGSGTAEVLTVVFMDLQGFIESARGQDPEVVLLTFNQMLADLEEVLERYKAQVLNYFGDGFMAILRQARHAERAVEAALDLMQAVRDFNRPREVLGQTLFQARIGINTGNVFLGNVGTYRKMDFTAVSPAVSLAARLLNWAEPGWPCLSRATHELLPDLFLYKTETPRVVTPTGLGPCEVWDATGRRSP